MATGLDAVNQCAKRCFALGCDPGSISKKGASRSLRSPLQNLASPADLLFWSG